MTKDKLDSEALKILTQKLARDKDARNSFEAEKLIEVLELIKEQGTKLVTVETQLMDANSNAALDTPDPLLEDELTRLLEACRVVRNAVSGVDRSVELTVIFFNSNFNILDLSETLLTILCKSRAAVKAADYELLLRVCIQLLSNLLTGVATGATPDPSESVKLSLFHFLSKHQKRLARLILGCQLGSETDAADRRWFDAKTAELASSLLLTLLRNYRNFVDSKVRGDYNEESEESLNEVDLEDLIRGLLHVLDELEQAEQAQHEKTLPGTTGFSVLCLREILTNPVIFTSLKTEARLRLVEFIEDCDDDILSERYPTECIAQLATDFNMQTDVILTTMLGSVSQLTPSHVVQLLRVLTTASHRPSHKAVLQENKSLLLNTFYTLRMVHEAGKSGVEALKPLNKLSEMEKLCHKKSDFKEVRESPVFGFKANLIRLLVNLTWKNPENQATLGELEAVQLLLDCSQMDGRNPLITQWVIMAIRALTEDHRENQAVLAGLRREGVADASLLAELGIQLTEDGKIKMTKESK